MKNYFSVLKWVSNMDYSPDDNEVKNALVPTFYSWNQDFKIGERIIPNYELLWKLHTACVDWIHLENNAFNPERLDLRMEYVFDTYERVDNTTYLSWLLSNDPDLAIPDWLDVEGNLMESYKKYRDKYFESTITEKTQENNMNFFFKELNVLARIEVVDIIYDFINDSKIYVLEMKEFTY